MKKVIILIGSYCSGKTETAINMAISASEAGKRTLVVVHALANAAPAARERLIQILSAKEKDPAVLAEAVDIMRATGSVEYARAYAENLTNTAKGRLVEKVGPSLSRDLLISMADWFVNRLK